MAAISPLSLLRPFDQFLDAPALVGGQRAALDDLHAIARLEFVFLVVRFVLRPAVQVLAVLGVRYATLDHHDARFVHLVARDDADHPALVDFVTGHFMSPLSSPGLASSSTRASSPSRPGLRSLPPWRPPGPRRPRECARPARC